MTVLVLFIATMALSLWAAARVKSVYHRYNRGSTYSGLTGAEAAHRILSGAGIGSGCCCAWSDFSLRV